MGRVDCFSTLIMGKCELVFTCLHMCCVLQIDSPFLRFSALPMSAPAESAPAAGAAASSSSDSCTPTVAVVKPLGKSIKLLLAHERALLASGDLVNVTHEGSSSVWLHAESTPASALADGMTLVYRPMGDAEVLHLLEHGGLPDSQPYQAIIEGAGGRVYSEKYLNGAKWTNTHPSTVVEFTVPSALIADLMARQHKAEDGAISMGLGDKAGKGLPLFNAALADSATGSSFRIVKVKRRVSTAAPKRKF